MNTLKNPTSVSVSRKGSAGFCVDACCRAGVGVFIMPSAITTEEFIRRSTIKHNGKYDYSFSVYKNRKKKVCVICPVHGRFWVVAYSHYSVGRNCNKCRCDKRGTTYDEFVSASVLNHGGKYDYSMAYFKNLKDNIPVVCPIHGVWWVRVSSHLKGNTGRGHGCKQCHMDSIHKRYSTSEIIDKFRQVHGDRYNYSCVKYSGITQNVEIICKLHGSFFQQPSNHLQGSGCMHCGRIRGLRRLHFQNSLRSPIIYVAKLKNSEESFFKIGITGKKSAKKRFATTMPYEVDIIIEKKVVQAVAYDIELELHRKHKQWQFTPLIKFSGHTECYTFIDEELINKTLDEYVCIS